MSLSEKRPMTRWERIKDNDIYWSFINSPGAMIAAAITVICILAVFRRADHRPVRSVRP